jgi:hypothetical protein
LTKVKSIFSKTMRKARADFSGFDRKGNLAGNWYRASKSISWNRRAIVRNISGICTTGCPQQLLDSMETGRRCHNPTFRRMCVQADCGRFAWGARRFAEPSRTVSLL